MTLLAGMIALWAALAAARGTPVGDVLHRWLVAKPAATLSRIRRQTVLAATVLIVTAFAAWWVIGHEGVLIYSMALPELTAALAMIDLTVMVDVAIAFVAAASAGGWRAVRTTLSHWLARARTPRTRRTRRPGKPAANDDGEGPVFALAA
ncbi:hypothetical protein P1X14_07690 [Sphingomonas sp. AOB5]|uniref:hypothetical protein n=1 Tax=Sphingomonas sp. AOB5 TaxID=3034017 RepID=UPI0023F951B5|nr:hypothetical protein [Sphingomonas sp. AOB5]MDF7775124.1 hypothetical protein [Sphingomonas sp. AOB5]